MFVFFFQAEDGIRDGHVTGVQTCALPILHAVVSSRPHRQAAPAAPDIEQRLPGAQRELATDVLELVLLGLLEFPVRVPVVRAGVDDERIKEQGVELVRHVVVVVDLPGRLPPSSTLYPYTSLFSSILCKFALPLSSPVFAGANSHK